MRRIEDERTQIIHELEDEDFVEGDERIVATVAQWKESGTIVICGSSGCLEFTPIEAKLIATAILKHGKEE